MKQGTIISVNFNPTKGHEQGGYRPALVISNSAYFNATNFVICCPITSANKRYLLHLKIPAGNPVHGVIMCDQVRTLDLADRKYSVIGEMDKSTLRECLEIVSEILELEIIAGEAIGELSEETEAES